MMSATTQGPVDEYARGLGLAAQRMIEHTLKALTANGSLTTQQATEILGDALSDFVRPYPTHAEAVAIATITTIRDGFLPKP